mgnify:CR=1 FL=1
MTRNILIIFCLTASSLTFGQNLVNNPDFEIANTEPSGTLTTDNNFTCIDWTSSTTKGSPDYFTTKRTGNYGAPSNLWGNRNPFSGNAYGGIAINHAGLGSYEYLQVKLTQKLVKDNYYCLSLVVSPADTRNFSSNEIDYLFSTEKQEHNTGGLIKTSSYEKFIASKGYFEEKAWNKIQACYKAKGDEEFLTIGIFNEKFKRISLTSVPPAFDGIYFYIDNVSVTPVPNISDCKCNELTVIKAKTTNYDLAIGKSLVLKNINFETNKAELLSSSNAELNKLASYLKSNPTYKIEVIGYTDNVGKENDNVTLSKSRAKAVGDFLINSGISKDRITFKGLGSQSPIKPNDSEENRQLNRRVEFKIAK